jgi:hypothetical protein
VKQCFTSCIGTAETAEKARGKLGGCDGYESQRTEITDIHVVLFPQSLAINSGGQSAGENQKEDG